MATNQRDMLILTDDQIRDLRDESSYPSEIYAKCQSALGAYGDRCSSARADLVAFCRSLYGYVRDNGSAELDRERKRFVRLFEEWALR